MMTEDEIVDDVISKIPDEDKDRLRFFAEKYNKHYLHHGFGTWIRNEYKLWQRPWIPKIIDGCDYAEDHPDQISMRIIEKILKKLEV